MKKNIYGLLLFVTLILGMFLRVYDFRNRFYYGHDNDLASWIVRDIVVDRHVRLIGQLTSAPGIFIGSLFYYLLVPFYLIGNMDPIYSVGFSWVIGALAIGSVYFIVTKIHGKSAGVIAVILYAISFSIVSTEREVVPTTGVFLWSIWFYYGIHLWSQGKSKALYIFAVLFSLVWHIHLVLGILSIIVLIFLPKNFKSLNIKHVFIAAILFVLLASPLFIFELRHDFSQTKSLFGSFEGHARVERTVPQRIVHVLEYMEKNINQIIWDKPTIVNSHILPLLLLCGTLVLFVSKKIDTKTVAIIAIWILLFVGFFTFHPINLSEYYVNSLNIVWVIIFALIGAEIFKSSIGKLLILAALGLFVYHNISRNLQTTVNHSGYVKKNQVIYDIATDAQNHKYPCVRISYITDAGNNLGYRYLIWRQNIKVSDIRSNAPVYSIVYPLSLVSHVDKSDGAIGIIYPKYSDYTPTGIMDSCAGPDTNVTGSMFGFTK